MIRLVNLETQEGAIFKETGYAQAMHLKRGQKRLIKLRQLSGEQVPQDT